MRKSPSVGEVISLFPVELEITRELDSDQGGTGEFVSDSTHNFNQSAAHIQDTATGHLDSRCCSP